MYRYFIKHFSLTKLLLAKTESRSNVVVEVVQEFSIELTLFVQGDDDVKGLLFY
jgi:hypothetical protein